MCVTPVAPSWTSVACESSPTTAGTRDPPGETKIVTVLPNLAFVPGDGSCLTTVLGGAVELLAVCSLTWNPSDRRMLSASPTLWCLTLGTSTIFGPLDTTIVTFVPAGTTFPFGGLVLITMSLATVGSD